MEISPQLPCCSNFGLKKQFPVQVLRGHEITCASELKPHIHNNEDPWEKIHHFKYWNSLDRYPIVIFAMWLLSREFLYLKWWFFSHGSSLLWIWGLSSEAQVIWPFQTCLNWYHIAQIGEKSFFGLVGVKFHRNEKFQKTEVIYFMFGTSSFMGGSQIQILHFIRPPYW